jgi:hypothetical protein
MVEQQTRNLREDLSRNIEATRQDVEATRRDLEATRHDLEDTRRDLETQLAAVETRTRRAGGGNKGANADKAKPPRFDGSTSWAVSYRQLEAAAIHNDWTPRETASECSARTGRRYSAQCPSHSVVRGHRWGTARSIQGPPTGGGLPATALGRVQMIGGTLQEFAASVEQLAPGAFFH